MIKNLGESNSIFNNFISEIRSSDIQKERMRFRKNMERCAEIFAYEISKTLNYKQVEVNTPLGVSNISVISSVPVIACIMRAGLPMHQGFLNYFDNADNMFISAYRKYNKDGTFDISFEHISGPSTEGRTVILADPMIATGASMVLAYKALIEKGRPKHVHIVSLISCKEGLEHTLDNIGEKNITIWTGAIDEELTSKSYIVPGLGDAGDLAYGNKE